MAELATNSLYEGTSIREVGRNAALHIAVFSTSVETLQHYAKWARGSCRHEQVVVEACLLDQKLERREDILATLALLGFDSSRVHVLDNDGVTDPDVYVDPFDGGIGAAGAYAVPNLEDKALYLFDNISVSDGIRPAKNKLYRLMRLMAGIPRQRGLAVLFDGRSDRVCFSQHCIRTLDGRQRDMVIEEALELLLQEQQR